MRSSFTWKACVFTFLAACVGLTGTLFCSSTSHAGPLQDKIMTFTYHQKMLDFMSDTTWIYHDLSVGTLVTYLGSGGSPAVAWYPGGDTVVSGRWGGGTLSSQRPDLTIFCLYLGAGVAVLPPEHNVGVSQDRGSRCYNLLNFSRNVRTVLDGDPYGLRRARGAPGVIVDRRRYSAQALMQIAGGDQAALRQVDLSR